MYSRIFLFLLVITGLVYVVFADYLRAVWLVDRDKFWMIVTGYLFVFLVVSFWLWILAAQSKVWPEDDEDDSSGG